MATAASTGPGSSKRSSADPTGHPSPVRKRQRTSSVSSDTEEFSNELDADGRAPLDVIKQYHTQQTTSDRGQSPEIDVSAAAAVAVALDVASATEAPTSATTVPTVVGSAWPSLLGTARSCSSSPHPDATIDYWSWFTNTTDNSAKMSTSTELPSFVRASGGILSISTSALETALAKWQSWEQEDDQDDGPGASTTDRLKSISNVYSRPPKPAAVPAPLPVAAVPSAGRTLTPAPAVRTSVPPAPATPGRNPLSTGSTSRGVPRPTAVASASNAVLGSRRLGMTSRAHALAARPKFVTPFKRGIPRSTQPGKGTAGSTLQWIPSALPRSTP